MNEQISAKVIERAAVSVKMEGFKLSEKQKSLAVKLASGEIPYSRFIADCKSSKIYDYLENQ